MVNINVTIEDESIKEGMRVLSRGLSPEVTVDDMELVAEEIIRRAIDSPIPSDTRALAHSAVVVAGKEKVTFGFSKIYAAFQDAPGQVAPHVIVPRVKKILYIPISVRGRRNHRYGNNPKDEGLVRGVDYVLSPRVTIPIKAYSLAIGPNHYFSETIKRNTEFIFEAISDRTARRLGKRFPASKKRLPGGKKGKR